MRRIVPLFTIVLFATGVAHAQSGGPIRNFLRVNESFCTGGQPTMEQLVQLKADGVKSVINLRVPTEHNADEEIRRAQELGLKYFNIPVVGSAPKDEQADAFLKLTDNPENRPAFIHCTAAVRVGGFWFIRRVVRDGWKVEEALAEARKVGLQDGPILNFAMQYIEKNRKK